MFLATFSPLQSQLFNWTLSQTSLVCNVTLIKIVHFSKTPNISKQLMIDHFYLKFFLKPTKIKIKIG